MQIIPVIDLKDGQAVHARQGQREHYQPLVTRFAASADPLAVTAGMLEHLPITAIYIADLDAIMHGAPNTVTVRAIAARYPQLRIIVDGGFGPAQSPAPYLAADNIDIVIASEANAAMDDYTVIRDTLPAARCLLSLDRDANGPRGCAALFAQPEAWPDRVIHMNLARVGAEGGPDFAGLETLLALAGTHRVLAAGGVRHRADLECLDRLGIDAVLIGTALHDGRLDAPDFDGLHSKTTSC
ncbi:MAG: HisA/HisF-related TIM barrel protein [Gammaproteobacteria bacterium]